MRTRTAPSCAALDRERRRHRRARIRERERELVAAAVDLLPALRRGGGAHGTAVLLERGRILVAELLHEARRALDVREQEGDAHARESTKTAAAARARGCRRRAGSRPRACPSSASTRSTRPRRPEPRAGSAPPTPSSATSTVARRPSHATRDDRRSGLRVLRDVRERLGDDVEDRHLDGAGQAARRATARARPGPVERSASDSSAASSPRSVRIAGWSPRASSRSSWSASASSVAGAGEDLRGGLRVGELRLGEPERERQRDEPLLRAVVQVALEPPPLRVGRLDETRARPAQLVLVALALRDVGAADQVVAVAVARERARPPLDRQLAAADGAPRCLERHRVAGGDRGEEGLAHRLDVLRRDDEIPEEPADRAVVVDSRRRGERRVDAAPVDRAVGVDGAEQRRRRPADAREEVVLALAARPRDARARSRRGR